ncbi:enoyl-[acyl-carrier-protein] reductase [NADH] [Alphaproteobacteria bacterium]|nr:enoyl-[acyl-carrier-protein] reductase [NADH] [Alphaproteobacteria bacterium]GHS99300.1 enoyl-[acyl-carrier-protein] reductase [NADH] [Alphaproteobacteria bacterium]
MGVANSASIAWGIAKTLHEEGAQLAFTYPNEAVKQRIDALSEEFFIAAPILKCDVAQEGDIPSVFETLQKKWGGVDFVLHSIAFSDRQQLTGRYMNTTRENFLNTLNISCFSLTEICKEVAPLMPQGGSVVALTYLGANRVIPHYNVMGVAKAALESSVRYLAVDLGPQNIRVNALSAGALRTAAGSGIGDFHYILSWNKNNAPLRRNVTHEEVGRSGLYLLSDLSSAVTGETHYVDCGYHVIGMKAVDAPDITIEK